MLGSMDFDGRRILITRGSRGIGREIAGLLAELGATVIVAARSREDVSSLPPSRRRNRKHQPSFSSLVNGVFAALQGPWRSGSFNPTIDGRQDLAPAPWRGRCRAEIAGSWPTQGAARWPGRQPPWGAQTQRATARCWRQSHRTVSRLQADSVQAGGAVAM